MRTTTTVTGDVDRVDHAATSASGNPTYRITLTTGERYLTSPDAMVAYGATNYRPHSLRRPVSPVVLTLNGRGRVVGIDRPAGWSGQD